MAKKKKEKDYKLFGSFLLTDKNIRNHIADGGNSSWGDRNLGRCVVAQALDQGAITTDPPGIDLNPTGVNGFCTGLYYGMLFEAGKDGWKRYMTDEWIETSHASPEYHQMILGQKGAYQDKIKQGLAGISQSVADLELLEHDVRKYEEYHGYLDDIDSDDETKKRKAMFAVKTIFVDQVDFHAGGGSQGAGRLSLAFMRNNNIMPTIVNDFIEMKSLDDIREGGRFFHLPDVEKKMLESKWTLYEHWTGVFRSAIKQRLDRLNTLKRSRDYTVEQYRNWLKPVIARYKMIDAGMSRPDTRREIREHFYLSAGKGVSIHGWTAWVWKVITNPEINRGPGELTAQAADAGEYGEIFGFDQWIQDNLIFNPDHGLVASYPWLRKDWIVEKAKAISKSIKIMTPYYSFMTVYTEQTSNKTLSGAIVEDTDFILNMYLLSANAFLAKQLERDAKQEELERYINNLLGIPPDIEKHNGIIIGYKKEGRKYVVIWNEGKIPRDECGSKKEMEEKYPAPKYYLTPVIPVDPTTDSSFLRLKQSLGLDGWFYKKRGPYEHQFFTRITKFYFKLSGSRFEGLYGVILRNMKIEEP